MTQADEWRKRTLENKDRLFQERVENLDTELLDDVERYVQEGCSSFRVRVVGKSVFEVIAERFTARGCVCEFMQLSDSIEYLSISWDHA